MRADNPHAARFDAFLRALPVELAFSDEEPAAIVDRYYAPDLEYVNDGIQLDRERLIAHVHAVRKNARSLRIDVHDTLVNGHRGAARYTIHATMRKDRRAATDVYLFAEFAADGRVRRINSITRIP